MLSLSDTVAAIVCLAALAIPLYVYLGYPLTLLAFHGRVNRTVVGKRQRVTVVIAAYNEVGHIAATVRNKLTQDYPGDLLDVVVVSDGSTDGTDAAVAELGDRRVRLLRQEPRKGKTSALNLAIATVSSDIVVFSDANSLYEPDAIRHLVAHFGEPSVGYATGRLVYVAPGESAVGTGSGMYMRYENWLRVLETRAGSVVGVNGGIDAVRRDLYRPMRPDDLPDFILPLRVVEQGYRVTYCPEAVAREAALGRQTDEFRMRVRVSLRALHALWTMRRLLHPRFGLFAFQLLVHKVLRYLVVVAMIVVFFGSAIFARYPAFRPLLAVQCVFYGLALLGWFSRGRIALRPVFVPYYFCLVNLAAGVALIRFLRGERQVTWNPRKGA